MSNGCSYWASPRIHLGSNVFMLCDILAPVENLCCVSLPVFIRACGHPIATVHQRHERVDLPHRSGKLLVNKYGWATALHPRIASAPVHHSGSAMFKESTVQPVLNSVYGSVQIPARSNANNLRFIDSITKYEVR